MNSGVAWGDFGRGARWLLFLGLMTSPLAAYTVELTGSGDRLKMMQKIQGVWRLHCQPIGSRLISRDVQFSYTQLTFTHSEYADQHCLKLKRTVTQVFPFILGEPLQVIKGSPVYKLSLKMTDENRSRYLHPNNLIHFYDGGLYFGLREGLTQEELTQVDFSIAYRR